MSERTISGYADAIHQIATAEGKLTEVEDELFRVAQAFEANDDLRAALTDAHLPAAGRQQVVEDLLAGRASRVTVGIVSLVVGAGRAADLPLIARAVLDMGAAERNHAIAEVRSAVPLSSAQRDRLATALKQSTGKDVEIKVVIDPSVLGGIVTQIGDTVIDGTVRHRLNKVREALA
jgi:F-type H+-transporting ATPase subunit delta